MKLTNLRVALISGLLTCTSAFAANSPDLDRVEATLNVLQASVNARDFSILEPQLDEAFSYQGRDPDLSRMIMRQVIQGYPHDIAGIAVQDAAADGSSWSISVMIAGPNGPEQRQIQLGADYRIQQADIADIQLAGHEQSQPSPSSSTPAPRPSTTPGTTPAPGTATSGTCSAMCGRLIKSGPMSFIATSASRLPSSPRSCSGPGTRRIRLRAGSEL